jgi:hypothetical protein
MMKNWGKERMVDEEEEGTGTRQINEIGKM